MTTRRPHDPPAKRDIRAIHSRTVVGLPSLPPAGSGITSYLPSGIPQRFRPSRLVQDWAEIGRPTPVAHGVKGGPPIEIEVFLASTKLLVAMSYNRKEQAGTRSIHSNFEVNYAGHDPW